VYLPVIKGLESLAYRCLNCILVIHVNSIHVRLSDEVLGIWMLACNLQTLASMYKVYRWSLAMYKHLLLCVKVWFRGPIFVTS